MNLENVDEKIQLLLEELFLIEKTKGRLVTIKLQLDLLYRKLEQSEAKVQKEHRDVLRLEKSSIVSLFKNILGNEEKQLEKERQEYLQAVLKYNSIFNEIEVMKYEQELLEKKSMDDSEIRQKLDYYLKLKEQSILDQNLEHASQIIEINKKIDQLQAFKRELKEAKVVTLVVQKVIVRALTKLQKIREFRFSKKSGVSRKMPFVKKSFIDSTFKDASEINFYLRRLDKELKEVYSQYTFFSVYKYQNFIESFHDNLISDWVLQNKLKNAIICLQSADEQIKEVFTRLNKDLSKTNDSLNKLVAEKMELIRNT